MPLRCADKMQDTSSSFMSLAPSITVSEPAETSLPVPYLVLSAFRFHGRTSHGSSGDAQVLLLLEPLHTLLLTLECVPGAVRGLPHTRSNLHQPLPSPLSARAPTTGPLSFLHGRSPTHCRA